MEQTALEWLENKVWELDNENFTVPNELLEMISYAKELEEEQIKDAWKDGRYSNTGCGDSEQYYKETFKQD